MNQDRSNNPLPPSLREFSLMPFWFWNDHLTEDEILRQIADFESHGVHGFVIHPRVGLPRNLGWMSKPLLDFMDLAIREAKRRDMRVMLYDEGMYPSGSSSGQLVAANPDFACRCIAIQSNTTELKPNENEIARFGSMVIFDRPADAYIRGLHYIADGPAEDEPPMGDILNPKAVQKLIELVHEKFAARFSEFFGNTIIGIFTDEPNPLGKCREQNIYPGTRGILPEINRLLGYDFTPHLPALWDDSIEDAPKHRADYQWAIDRRMEETWYQPLSQWCEKHNLSLCGHPKNGDEIAVHRFFHIPGQDLVWRFIEPNKPSAIEGPESTQAKNSSSAMLHRGRRRNSNEFCGAYGHETTFEEFQWLANWCLVRGVNLLIPHAFYYSIRGPRKDERPPQVGPHSAWWPNFKTFADRCTNLCWLNTDSEHVCEVAILTGPDHCPWQAAKICLQNQIDFNYLELDLLSTIATVNKNGIQIAGMNYKIAIIESHLELSREIQEKLKPLIETGRVIQFSPLQAQWLLTAMRQQITPDVILNPPHPNLRIRHVRKANQDFYILFNEGPTQIETTATLHADTKPHQLSLPEFSIEVIECEGQIDTNLI